MVVGAYMLLGHLIALSSDSSIQPQKKKPLLEIAKKNGKLKKKKEKDKREINNERGDPFPLSNATP